MSQQEEREPSKAPEKFLKPYDPGSVEATIYARWEESGYFNPDNLPPIEAADGTTHERTEPFSVVLPPPNVTGTLHMGSALMLVIEDILVRFQRMRGKKTLWIPGTDSAAIATQARVEKNIQKEEGKSRYDLGREELLRRIGLFVEENKSSIINQLKRMGSSLDWSRYAYTMDEKRYAAVMEAFVRMYEAGLIYRGNRIVNWDPRGQTTISDDEIVYEERDATLVTFKYSKDFPIAIATTRLETKVGDTAVAVHPDDARYKAFVGKEYDAVFCGVPLHIKIIADESVDPAFGTGALGVTPAHSQIDWEIADRHNLPRPQVIDERAKMLVPGELNGKKVLEARGIVLAWLAKEGLLVGEETIKQNISTAERTGGIIEPLPKLQWFIDVNKPIARRGNKTLKELMREPVAKREVQIVPEHFEKTYSHWIDNLRDWCISRQIWFGHRIPVWYRKENFADRYVGITPPENPELWEQDPDVLDTWFSSALWTFSTLGWPEETADLKNFHPTSVLETGYDILFFWVARMILMSSFLVGEVPFKTVYLHGLVRDGQGRKLSKSLGNNIDPLDMGDKFGTDAVRVALVAGMAPGTDSKISEEKIRGYKSFANKLWNVARFVLENRDPGVDAAGHAHTEADQALVIEFNALAKDITSDLEGYRLHLAIEKIYHYVWDRFASEILEESKSIFRSEDAAAIQSRQATLMQLLAGSLKLLHPFMPFVTEEIWSSMPNVQGTHAQELLMIAPWPVK